MTTQASFLAVLNEAVCDTCRDFQLQAYAEFGGKISDSAYRLSIEDARAKTVNARVLHLMDMKWGKKGRIRMVNSHDLRYLLIEGRDFDIGLRPKKLDRNWRSYQAPTDQQESLRQYGVFSWAKKKTYHLFLGYRDAGEVERRITDIAITWERLERGVEVIKKLWNEADGERPTQFIQPDLSNVEAPRAKVRVRRRKDSGSKDASG